MSWCRATPARHAAGFVLAVLLAAGPAMADGGAQTTAPLDPAAAAAANRNWAMRAGQGVKRQWGVEVLGARLVSHDWMINFRYRVVDPAKARPLLQQKATAYLVDEASGARLAVPAMENIGELRQTTVPEAGRSYFVQFGNANQVVRRRRRA